MTMMVVIPIMAIMLYFSINQYFNERKIIEKQIELTTTQMGDLLMGSLRHGMLANSPEMMQDMLMGVSGNKLINRIWIIDLKGEVKVSNLPNESNAVWQLTDAGCIECHQYSAETRPRVAIHDPNGDEMIRVSTPIDNMPECQRCHPAEQKHLGILLIDTLLPDAEKNMQADLRNNLILSVCFSLVVGIAVYFLMSRLFVQKIEDLHKVLKTYSEGDFSIRLPNDDRNQDEFTMLGRTFNQMADKLKEHEARLAQRARVREQAIVEERERIGRELHDGIAQFLGYITTKTQAARLLIERGDPHKADEYMHQIEDETFKQAIDVRASILGLKMFGAESKGLASEIRRYLSQSNRFVDIEITLEVEPCIEELMLDPETEMQLLRIMQEAISNIRKHSQAQKARILLDCLDGDLVRLSICDNGVGFDMTTIGEKGQPHFGLATMRERANGFGGALDVQSTLQHGTVVSVVFKVPEMDK
jgi:signal transduction histidine kinase